MRLLSGPIRLLLPSLLALATGPQRLETRARSGRIEQACASCTARALSAHCTLTSGWVGLSLVRPCYVLLYLTMLCCAMDSYANTACGYACLCACLCACMSACRCTLCVYGAEKNRGGGRTWILAVMCHESRLDMVLVRDVTCNLAQSRRNSDTRALRCTLSATPSCPLRRPTRCRRSRARSFGVRT